MSGDRGKPPAPRWVLPSLVVLSLAAAWMALSCEYGPIKISVFNESGQLLTVQIVEVSETSGLRIAAWREHRLDPGQCAVESRDPSGDSILQLLVVRDNGHATHYTVRRYLGSGRRLTFHLRLTSVGLSHVQVREGVFGDFEDVEWDTH